MNPRQAAREILQSALVAVQPDVAVRRALRVHDGLLEVEGRGYKLAAFRRVIVVGAGKASAPMAAAVEEILSEAGLAVEGLVCVRYGHAVPTLNVRILEAGHPLPDAAGVQATVEMIQLLKGADERDLVLCLLSGGGSALMTLPAEGLSLADIQRVTDALLHRGAAIQELNAVRKHLDEVKGGGLLAAAAPAEVLTLALSDVVGSPLDVIASGPTVPDPSTWAQAMEIVRRYGLEKELPVSVSERLRRGLAGDVAETPKLGDSLFARSHVVLVGSNAVAAEAAVRAASDLGLEAMLLTTFIEGEASLVGAVLASLLREVEAYGRPLPRPCCLIAGGETTVTVRGGGLGGRNQEVALGASWTLRGLDNVVFAAVGTDGSDGPTSAAGAFVDGSTLDRAEVAGLDARRALAENDTFTFFERLGDLVVTGPTRTNVNDLFILLAL